MSELKEEFQEEKMDKRMPNRQFRKGILVGLACAAIILLGLNALKQFIVLRNSNKTVDESPKVATDQVKAKVDVLQRAVEEYYLQEPHIEDMQDGIYKGMIGALGDPYSTYYTQEELIEIQNQTQGIYYGIGAYIGVDPQTELPKLTKIMENTPAQESGLLADDILIKVGEESTKGKDAQEVVRMIKGEEGTKVLLTIYREQEPDYLEIEVERRKIEQPTVSSKMLDNGIAYIEIREFDDITISQFKDAYKKAQESNMKSLILDLRSNPGGNLSAVTEIARMMLPKGLIVYTEDKYGERAEYSCDGKNEIQVPMVVLVNGNSASASEILAGAIKDYGVGTIVGTTTYGKGIVQRIINLTDGSAVKLTVSNYFTPNGHNIHKLGIEPDEVVEFDAEQYLKDGTDNQLNHAIQMLSK